MLLSFSQRRILALLLPLFVFALVLYHVNSANSASAPGVLLARPAHSPVSPHRAPVAGIDSEALDALASYGPEDEDSRGSAAAQAHNDAVQRLLAPPPRFEQETTLNYLNYKWYTEAKIRALTACSVRGDCHPNAHKIVVFASVWCKMAFYMKYYGGEGVWCLSLQESMQRQGYTVLHAGSGDWPYIAHLHRQLGDMVKAVFVETDRTEYGNIKDFYGKGFPAWKAAGHTEIFWSLTVFSFSYYPSGMPTIVGLPWTVSAEPDRRLPGEPGFRNFTYLGYALQPDAAHTEYVPLAARPMQVFILAKRVQYFYDSWAPASFPREMITRALYELRDEFPTLEFIGSFGDDRTAEEKERLGPMAIPEGVRHIGKLNASEWDKVISQSRLLMGIGWPTTSPSPYRALARGVPFLNPHDYEDGKGTEDDPDSWAFAQHVSLLHTPEPYVYNVKAGDYTAFVRAIRSALTTEIKPYRFERMEQAAFDKRVADFIEADWKHEAEIILAARKAGRETQSGKGLGLFEI